MSWALRYLRFQARTFAGALSRPGPAVAAAWLLAIGLVALVATFSGYHPAADVDPSRASLPPDATHWLGTDHQGRDVFLRLCQATRAFVGPGVLAAVLATVLGAPLGVLAGALGGPTERAVRSLGAMVAAIPAVVLVLLVVTIASSDPWTLALAAGLAGWPAMVEVAADGAARLRVEGALRGWEAHGLAPLRILGVHLLWAASTPALARQGLATFGGFLVLETTLSYFDGFGVPQPWPSWGNMLVFDWGRTGGNPLAFLAPAAALIGAVWAVQVLTDALEAIADA